MLRGRHMRRGPKEGRYEHSRDGRMRDEGDMLLQSISRGPSRVFILAKGAVPPEDEQDGPQSCGRVPKPGPASKAG
jgi:hypothetical protein